MDPICGGCRNPITDPAEQVEKKFVIVDTGKIILLRRHDVCSEKYQSEKFRRVTDNEARLLQSPSAVRSRGLKMRQLTKISAEKTHNKDWFSKMRT